MDKIQLRRGTASQWTSANPILAAGEIGVETDTLSYKIGNGLTTWNSLSYKEVNNLFGAALVMTAIETPSLPTTGKLKIYAQNNAERTSPQWIDEFGLDTAIQSALYSNSFIFTTPIGGGSGGTFNTIGYSNVAVSSNTSSSNPALTPGTNLRNSLRRVNIASLATAGSGAGLRWQGLFLYRGEVFGKIPVGGFFFNTVYSITSTATDQRGFTGLFNSANQIPVTQVTNALVNCIGLGWDSTETTLSIIHNDAAGTANKIPLGTNFPSNNPDAVYDLSLFSIPNGETVGYKVKRLDTGAVASGIISTDLPAKATLLGAHHSINNNTTAASVSLDIMRMYLETDF